MPLREYEPMRAWMRKHVERYEAPADEMPTPRDTGLPVAIFWTHRVRSGKVR